jgi:hypothetical protein
MVNPVGLICKIEDHVDLSLEEQSMSQASLFFRFDLPHSKKVEQRINIQVLSCQYGIELACLNLLQQKCK